MKKRLFAGFVVLMSCMFPFGCFGQEETERLSSGEWEYCVNDDNTAAITAWNGEGESVVIPEEFDGHEVTAIGADVFRTRIELKDVTIPDSVTKIGEHAFDECTALKSIMIPDHVTEIGDYAFHLCEQLEDVTIPESVTRIGKKSFCACLMTDITIPRSVKEIGEWAFGSCLALSEIQVSPENENYTMIDNALVEKQSMTLICYPCGLTDPEYHIPEGVTKIGNNAFSYCDSLECITVPEGVTQIGVHSFSNCRGLKEITLPESLTKIDKYAFLNCKSLTLITIPQSVTEIGMDAFAYCKNLKISADENSCAQQYAKEHDIPLA